jgi:type III restriction enzyme
MREYQQEAFARFFDYMQNPEKLPIHLLFNMATGSGKTFVMAGLILYLYEQ